MDFTDKRSERGIIFTYTETIWTVGRSYNGNFHNFFIWFLNFKILSNGFFARQIMKWLGLYIFHQKMVAD